EVALLIYWPSRPLEITLHPKNHTPSKKVHDEKEQPINISSISRSTSTPAPSDPTSRSLAAGDDSSPPAGISVSSCVTMRRRLTDLAGRRKLLRLLAPEKTSEDWDRMRYTSACTRTNTANLNSASLQLARSRSMADLILSTTNRIGEPADE
uniref:Uncharacterized protein n=1 Tax=Triticum urartu TaxID=4572 RepID=A0A8R7UIZ8_TRIUA